MGVELVLGAAALALGAISTVGNIAATASAASDRKKSFDAQTAANDVTLNQQKNNSIYDRRARIREQRTRIAMMTQGAQNTGSNGSSGVAGGVSSLGSNFDSLIGQSEGQTKANTGLNKLNTIAAQYDENAKTTLAWNDVFQQGIKTTQTIFDL